MYMLREIYLCWVFLVSSVRYGDETRSIDRGWLLCHGSMIRSF